MIDAWRVVGFLCGCFAPFSELPPSVREIDRGPSIRYLVLVQWVHHKLLQGLVLFQTSTPGVFLKVRRKPYKVGIIFMDGVLVVRCRNLIENILGHEDIVLQDKKHAAGIFQWLDRSPCIQ